MAELTNSELRDFFHRGFGYRDDSSAFATSRSIVSNCAMDEARRIAYGIFKDGKEATNGQVCRAGYEALYERDGNLGIVAETFKGEARLADGTTVTIPPAANIDAALMLAWHPQVQNNPALAPNFGQGLALLMSDKIALQAGLAWADANPGKDLRAAMPDIVVAEMSRLLAAKGQQLTPEGIEQLRTQTRDAVAAVKSPTGTAEINAALEKCLADMYRSNGIFQENKLFCAFTGEALGDEIRAQVTPRAQTRADAVQGSVAPKR